MVTKVTAVLFLFLIASQSNLMKATENSTCTECHEICDTYKKLKQDSKDHDCLTKHKQKKCKEVAAAFFSNRSIICPTVATTIESQCPTAIVPTTTVSRCDTTIKTTTMLHLYCPSSSQTSLIATSTATANKSSQSSCPCTTGTVNRIQFTIVNKAIVGLLGLSLLLLVVVTTGWVCTCLITKKRKRMMEVTTDDTTDFAEKYFENPTYDGTSMIRIHSKPSQGVNRVPVLPVAVRQHQQASSQAALSGAGTTYDAVNTASPKAAGNGQTYDVLDRGKSNCTARKSARAPRGYSQLGVPDKDVVDSKYHLISKEND